MCQRHTILHLRWYERALSDDPLSNLDNGLSTTPIYRDLINRFQTNSVDNTILTFLHCCAEMVEISPKPHLQQINQRIRLKLFTNSIFEVYHLKTKNCPSRTNNVQAPRYRILLLHFYRKYQSTCQIYVCSIEIRNEFSPTLIFANCERIKCSVTPEFNHSLLVLLYF